MIPGLSTIQVALIGLAATVLVGGIQEIRLRGWQADAREAIAEARGHALSASTLRTEVRQGQQAVAEAAAANQSNLVTLHAAHAATAALRAETQRLEVALASSRRAAAKALAEADAEDRAIEARADLTSAAEINRVLRARGDGWLWR